jgi:hypothetical protein
MQDKGPLLLPLPRLLLLLLLPFELLLLLLWEPQCGEV